uniref:Thioredoxin domain-containing protein n=1 Tax=Parascaris univalens TaxID=6257 RepID=A0A914ZRU2_PARUN
MDASSQLSEQHLNLIIEFADEQAQQAVSEALESLDHSRVRTTPRIAHSDEEKRSSLEVALDALGQRLTMRSFCGLIVLYALLMCFISFIRSDGQLARRPAPPPMPFFRWSAREYVSDYYGGNGAHPSILLRHSEIVIAMYYAPWNLDSKLMRRAFERVARSFDSNDDVSFAAINCFAAQGQCRNTYRTHMFPLLMAYIGDVALMYNGELAADYIRRWILYIRNPIHRLISEQSVKDFCSEYDDAVLAYFPIDSLLQRSWRYKEYLIASLTASQYEELVDRSGFAIVTDWWMANALNFAYEGHIQLFQYSKRVDYPLEKNYSSALITEWLRDESASSNTLHWLVPEANTMLKVDRLQTTLRTAPTLILFTPREPLYPYKSDVSVLEQTIMEYHTCQEEDVNRVRELAENREGYRQRRKSLLQDKRLSCRATSDSASQVSRCCAGARKWLDLHCKQCRLERTYPRFTVCALWNPFRRTDQRFPFFGSPWCREAAASISVEELADVCCPLFDASQKGTVSKVSPTQLCNEYKLAAVKSDSVLSKGDVGGSPFDTTLVVGLSCMRNNSLRFIAVDTQHYGFLLEKLGIASTVQSNVVIADARNEQTLIMSHAFSRQALREFIHSFHNGSLLPHRLTEERLPQNFHKRGRQHSYTSGDENLVQATTARRFNADLLNASSSQDVVVLLSGGAWHGPSAAVFYIYHTVAYYFKPFEALLKFFIVDVSKNEIPWQFKMDRIPAVLFLPAKRRFASSRLPRSVPMTVPSLIAFVLTRCQPELRWRIALSLCSVLCVRRNVLALRLRAESLRNELSSLRQLIATLHLKGRHALLVDRVIQRRAAQLRVCRKVLDVVSSMSSPTNIRLFEKAAELSRQSETIRTLFEASIPLHILTSA